jgi:hypothetical protein
MTKNLFVQDQREIRGGGGSIGTLPKAYFLLFSAVCVQYTCSSFLQSELALSAQLIFSFNDLYLLTQGRKNFILEIPTLDLTEKRDGFKFLNQLCYLLADS